MSTLRQIEQEFGFEYPELYHRLHADGMLNWGNAGPDWISEQYPVLRKDPPLLLFANDFELSQLKDVVLQLKDFSDPGYWMNIKPGLRFVPFAQNGAGDWYCFFPTEQKGTDIPIVLLWHDANRVEYKARNLQDFIFRAMLEAVADIEEAEYGLLQEHNFKEDLQHFHRTHQAYLTEEQLQVITRIYQTPAANKPLISEEQLAQMIAFENIDKVFSYQA